MKRWKKLLAASLTAAALLGTSQVDAAYSLNEEVKNPTPALIQASQIGVLKYVNPAPAMKYAPNKDAIVVLSFGTTYKETRAKTIDATANAIAKEHPGVKVVTAFTSHIVIDHIIENEGKCDYKTPEETLADLQRQGYNRIALVSLDVIPGMEYNYGVGVFHNYKEQFKAMTLGTSLMYWQGQEDQPDDVLETMKAMDFRAYKKGTAILVMAHGTPSPSNAYYSVMQAKLKELGRKDVHIYTVEGWPRLEDWIPKLKKHKVQKIVLMPLMMVAGDHASNDMAGDEEDSHKKILEAEGFQVETIVKGIGENKKIQRLYVERANDAWDALESD